MHILTSEIVHGLALLKTRSITVDIIFHENKLYAVKGTFSHVEIWDFSGSSPKKLAKLEVSIPTKLWSTRYFSEHSDCWRLYLVESNGKILLVARQIADYY